MTNKLLILFFSDNGGNMYDIVNGENPTNNYPLKFGKGNIHEGGIRVPCIISWKDVIEPNSVSDQIIQSTDFYPTFLEVTELDPQQGQLLDGMSILNLITNQEHLEREAIFCHFPHYTSAVTHNVPSTAVWSDNFKLIKEYGEGANQAPDYHLYDLEKDIGESTDLSEQHPEVVGRLTQLIEDHLQQIRAIIPINNPVYDPSAESLMRIQRDFPIERYPSF